MCVNMNGGGESKNTGTFAHHGITWQHVYIWQLLVFFVFKQVYIVVDMCGLVLVAVLTACVCVCIHYLCVCEFVCECLCECARLQMYL